MKRYFRIGLGVIIPVALVLQIGLWLVTITNWFFNALLGIELTWWGVLASLLITVVAIAIVGFVVAHSKLVRNTKAWVEKQLIDKLPIVRPIYNFGKEVVETFGGDLRQEKDFKEWFLKIKNKNISLFIEKSSNEKDKQEYYEIIERSGFTTTKTRGKKPSTPKVVKPKTQRELNIKNFLNNS
jgi:uncharacterized membrane protein